MGVFNNCLLPQLDIFGQWIIYSIGHNSGRDENHVLYPQRSPGLLEISSGDILSTLFIISREWHDHDVNSCQIQE